MRQPNVKGVRMSMIIVRNLTKTLSDGTEILSNISFQVDPGEFVVILGASGSGKSTLLKCLFLQERWTKGQLIYDGAELSGARWTDKLKLRKEWAFLEEKPALNPRRTAFKNVVGGRFFHLPVWRKLTGTVSTDEHVLAMDYLEKVGLLDKAHSPVEKLSGGEQQRVAIARALAKGAKVILADDPTKGLDPESAHRVLQDFRNLCKNEQIIVLCCMQNLDMAERNATRIWGLRRGRLVLDIAARRLTMREKEMIF